MGFFDTVGKIAKGASEAAEKKAKEIKQTKQKLEGYSDDKLADIMEDDSFLGASSMEKQIAKKILLDRGYNV